MPEWQRNLYHTVILLLVGMLGGGVSSWMTQVSDLKVRTAVLESESMHMSAELKSIGHKLDELRDLLEKRGK